MDGLWLRYWPYQAWLPNAPDEDVETPFEAGDRIPGLVDECN